MERGLIYRLSRCICKICGCRMWDSGSGIWSGMRYGEIEHWGKIGKYSGAPHIHHLDGNHKNNDPNNLILVCPSCHKTFHKTRKDS